MANIGLSYGSTTGSTVKAAELIQQAFEPEIVDLLDVRKATSEDLKQYDTLIFGTPTWHRGSLQPV